jgi:hypothetical protein
MDVRRIVKENTARWMNEKPDVDARKKARGARMAANRGIFKARLAATRANWKARAAAARATASRPQISGGSKKAIGAAGLAGAASAFFLDPKSGHSRRDSLLRFVQRDDGRPEDEIASAPSPAAAAGNAQTQKEPAG